MAQRSTRYEARKYIMFNKVTYVGRIHYYEDGRFLFSESCGIHRTTKEDALNDCAWLYNDRYGTERSCTY